MHAVIMTGGKGLRMAPYTKVLPKGLLPIHDKPILDTIVHQLQYYGFTSITMACGYLAPLIQTYFGDGSQWDVSITYQIEEQPLGTAGPLKTINQIDKPFLVINCDVLTNLNFKELYDFHCSGSQWLTVASQRKEIPFELGVLETEEDRVIRFLEKPNQSAYVSMGIYVLNPEVTRYIPDNTFFDLPDLIQALLSKQKEVKHYQNDSFWIDIGKPAQFKEANEIFPSIKDQLRPGEKP